MKIADIRATTVTVPLEAPLRPGWTPTPANNRWVDAADDHWPHLNNQPANAVANAALVLPLALGRSR